jgi:hypothetical protein
MSDDAKLPRSNVTRLAHELAGHAAELLRMLRIRSGQSRVYENPQFTSWLASEARDIVDSGLAADPWTEEERQNLAQSLRSAVLAQQSGIRQIAGAPTSIVSPEAERGTAGYTGRSRRGAAPWVKLATAAGIGREIWDEECDSWVTVPDDLPAGNYVALNVRGDSMVPLLDDGDTVLVAMGVETRNGNIVLARTDEGYVVKRLKRITTLGVYLESLNPEHEGIVIRDIEQPIAGTVMLRWCPHQPT